ncbi:DUF1801 domain-containing protein [Exiguobacterium sp. UBA5002]|uniref:DUF1801 domain-containing protein n=1 Tax=Exiguobacterium sp. UBA5002 TaxID=1946497 RepID=UPI0025C209DD|nr:DUF1801 domain-containing protein [Exiguobacterium sp. UBA5002]
MPDTPKTGPTEQSVDAFLAQVEPPQRQADGITLRQFFEDVTGYEAVLWGSSLIGFGSYHYRYASGREDDSFYVGFSPQKTNLVLYLALGEDAVSERLLASLGTYRRGKSCIYVKRLTDIDLGILREMIEHSIRTLKTMYPS